MVKFLLIALLCFLAMCIYCSLQVPYPTEIANKRIIILCKQNMMHCQENGKIAHSVSCEIPKDLPQKNFEVRTWISKNGKIAFPLWLEKNSDKPSGYSLITPQRKGREITAWIGYGIPVIIQ